MVWLDFNKEYMYHEKPSCDNCGDAATGQKVKNPKNIEILCDKCKEVM